VTLIRNPPAGCLIDPYQVLRALLHQHAVAVPSHQPETVGSDSANVSAFDSDASPVSEWDSTFYASEAFSEDDLNVSLQPRKVHFPVLAVDSERPPKEKMEDEEEILPVDQAEQPRLSEQSQAVPLQSPPQPLPGPQMIEGLAAPAPARTANRICDVAVRDRLLYVKIGYKDQPDNEDDLSWFFFKDLAEPDKRNWLRKFVHANVAGIKDSGWKSLPGLLAGAGAPVPVLKKRSVLARPNAGGDCNAQSMMAQPLRMDDSKSGVSASDSLNGSEKPSH
jgi:hypothetical protein